MPGAFATAKDQWEDWEKFRVEYEDLVVGWNWWANSAANTDNVTWWDDADSSNGERWSLTLDDGATQTVYMDLIQKSLL